MCEWQQPFFIIIFFNVNIGGKNKYHCDFLCFYEDESGYEVLSLLPNFSDNDFFKSEQQISTTVANLYFKSHANPLAKTVEDGQV